MTMSRALLRLAPAIRVAPASHLGWLLAVAVGGSAIYGASVSLVLPQWSNLGGAIWLTLSAGLAWCVFIPALWFATRLPVWRCIEASLTTMAAGEVVLVSGALANAILWHQGMIAHAVAINFAIVGISNATMATVLVSELRDWRISPSRTLALWMFVLNGSGAVFFAALYPWLSGR
jgi:hypothetical protein